MAEDSWFIVLTITVLGMGLLFLALAFFYGLLAAMARLLQDRVGAPGGRRAAPPAVVGTELPAARAGEEELRLRAAAIAVALARAGLGAPRASTTGVPGKEGTAASAWWSLHHQRRLGRGSRAGRSL